MRIAAVFTTVLAALAGVACGPPAESCGPPQTCVNSRNWRACCTAAQCRYRASDGKAFACVGVDCKPNLANVAVAAWCNNGESCAPTATCPQGGTYRGCCNTTQCRYVSGDTTLFACQGTDCTAGSNASKQASDWCATH